jgi:3-oxoacyl-[acyl-carrier protein] reductase
MSNNNGQKLAGRVAVVTGGSRGIGAAIAKRLASDGASVAVTCSKGADAAASVVKEIERAGRRAIAIQAEAADADAVKAAVEKAVATFGRPDVLVNNAGTAIPKKFEEATLEEMDRVIDINVRVVFVATQAALKHMHEQKMVAEAVAKARELGATASCRSQTPHSCEYWTAQPSRSTSSITTKEEQQ